MKSGFYSLPAPPVNLAYRFLVVFTYQPAKADGILPCRLSFGGGLDAKKTKRGRLKIRFRRPPALFFQKGALQDNQPVLFIQYRAAAEHIVFAAVEFL